MKSPLPKINENFTLLLIERLSTRAAPPADDEVVGRAIFFSPPASANRLVLFPASIHLLSHGNFEIAAFLSTDSRRKKSVESWSGTEEEYIGMDPLSGFSSFFFIFFNLFSLFFSLAFNWNLLSPVDRCRVIPHTRPAAIRLVSFSSFHSPSPHPLVCFRNLIDFFFKKLWEPFINQSHNESKDNPDVH